jgi:hypothetical protein
MNDKISAKHLERAAYVYIRQSTLQQVRHNLESSRRQYALQDRARELGFQEVVVIDEISAFPGQATTSVPGSAGFWRRSVMVESASYWQWKRPGLLAIIATGTI